MLLALCSAPALAAVLASGPDGFTVRHDVLVPVPAAAAYAAALKPAAWWNPDHSYSGDAANLTVRAKPGGCWCERLPGGGFVEHLRVVAVLPGELLRLVGALGPLQELGASGAWTWTFTPEAGGTRVATTYAVRGAPGDELATPVDEVLGEAIGRYAAHLGAAAAP